MWQKHVRKDAEAEDLRKMLTLQPRQDSRFQYFIINYYIFRNPLIA